MTLLRSFVSSSAVLAGVVCAALLAGCSSAPKPTTVTATISTAADVNPDARKRPSPLVVRIYELGGAAQFEAADFLSLYERDRETLGGDLIAKEEWVMRPGEKREWKKTLSPQAKFVGVVAGYRDLERARWRAVVGVKPQVENVLTIRADALAVAASVAAK